MRYNFCPHGIGIGVIWNIWYYIMDYAHTVTRLSLPETCVLVIDRDSLMDYTVSILPETLMRFRVFDSIFELCYKEVMYIEFNSN